MRFQPEIDSDVTRLLSWLAALTALALFSASRAGAAEPAAQRPPVSPAAVKQATETKPAPETPATEMKQATETKQAPGTKQATAPAPHAPPTSKATAPADSGMTLRGGQPRTDFRTMTVEGEDRVHLEVERPSLSLDLDPEKVGGLEPGTAGDVLNRVSPDLTSAFLGVSAHNALPYLARPWLRQFGTGPVARFEPSVKDVDRWKLVVADSKGQTVTTFQGKGDPPKEITWDGRSQGGALVTPGLTYSYIFEAYDRAGNKRNFVGEGFRVSAYRIDSPEGGVLVFSGQSLAGPPRSQRSQGLGGDASSRAISPVILEAADWLNQDSHFSQSVRVTATARSQEQANFLAGRVSAALTELALGDPARIQTATEVVPDAPDGGTVRIAGK